MVRMVMFQIMFVRLFVLRFGISNTPCSVVNKIDRPPRRNILIQTSLKHTLRADAYRRGDLVRAYSRHVHVSGTPTLGETG
jgi:hypothetical protein